MNNKTQNLLSLFITNSVRKGLLLLVLTPACTIHNSFSQKYRSLFKVNYPIELYNDFMTYHKLVRELEQFYTQYKIAEHASGNSSFVDGSIRQNCLSTYLSNLVEFDRHINKELIEFPYYRSKFFKHHSKRQKLNLQKMMLISHFNLLTPIPGCTKTTAS